MRSLLPGEIRVVVRGAGWSKKRRVFCDRVYARRLVGVTVADAIKAIDWEGEMKVDCICPPYFLRQKGKGRVEVEANSSVVLQKGDVLSVDDP